MTNEEAVKREATREWNRNAVLVLVNDPDIRTIQGRSETHIGKPVRWSGIVPDDLGEHQREGYSNMEQRDRKGCYSRSKVPLPGM